MNLTMVMDVESIGLWGDGFAVGWVVLDLDNPEFKLKMLQIESCDPAYARGGNEGREWVSLNVPYNKPGFHFTHSSTRSIRATFWDAWQEWNGKGATLWADCGVPVEANFLRECILDGNGLRDWGGPYPLHEVDSFLLAAGVKREEHPRAYGVNKYGYAEMPEHNPVQDSIYSARLLHTAYWKLKNERLAK